jgi:hypothetical protein
VHPTTPEDEILALVEQIRAREAAGVEELMLHWVDTDNQEGLELLAEQVLPHFPARAA